MGNAKRRGDYEKRKREAIAAGRVKGVKEKRPRVRRETVSLPFGEFLYYRRDAL